jgi:hypothetical protein
MDTNLTLLASGYMPTTTCYNYRSKARYHTDKSAADVAALWLHSHRRRGLHPWTHRIRGELYRPALVLVTLKAKKKVARRPQRVPCGSTGGGIGGEGVSARVDSIPSLRSCARTRGGSVVLLNWDCGDV